MLDPRQNTDQVDGTACPRRRRKEHIQQHPKEANSQVRSLTDGDPEQTEVYDLGREALRIVLSLQLHRSAVPLDDTRFQHVVAYGLDTNGNPRNGRPANK